MEKYNSILDISSDEKTAFTIGKFEGIHLGHQQVFRKLAGYAEEHSLAPTVVSFLNDPRDITGSPDHLEKMIYPLEDREKFILECGIIRVIFVPFDETVSGIPAEKFLKDIVLDRMKTVYFICGRDFRFGKEAEGTAEMCSGILEGNGCNVDIEPHFMIDNEKVSSSKICRLVKKGEFGKASKLLGRDYHIRGNPEKGHGVGRELGFPTINLTYPDEVLIPEGVFAGWAGINGLRYPAAVNSGRRPTLCENGKNVVEIHVIKGEVPENIGFVDLFPVEKIRNEEKFESKEELIAQIKKDCLEAEKILE